MNHQERRMRIFQELTSLTYRNKLKEEIDSIPLKFCSEKTNNSKLAAVKNEILVSMGLNPTARHDTELSHEVDAALNLESIEFPVVTVNGVICDECSEKAHGQECPHNCVFDGKRKARSKRPIIDSGKCLSCGKCIPNCPFGAISDKIEFIPVTKHLHGNKPVYAAVAPAIAGQFGDATMGMLRSGLKSIGFTDMVEVAMFADMVTLKEADAFNSLVKTENDFMITSCCCPVWVNLLTKHYGKLAQRLTATVSPMIASGRVLKTLFPDCITVFIGPCIAKKSEAKLPELRGAIDYVLTFSELKEVFDALKINVSGLGDDRREQSSHGGRLYARTGGVSKAVQDTLDRIYPPRTLKFKAVQAEGVSECRALLERLKDGDIGANFIEGMGCTGGCVGGPRTNVSIEDGKKSINAYASEAETGNPIDNEAVKHLLKHLRELEKSGFDQLLLRQHKH